VRDLLTAHLREQTCSRVRTTVHSQHLDLYADRRRALAGPQRSFGTDEKAGELLLIVVRPDPDVNRANRA
jgi:hypothetical protein